MKEKTKKEKQPDTEMITLINDLLLQGELIPAGTQIKATAEIKKLLKPFGYFITNQS